MWPYYGEACKSRRPRRFDLSNWRWRQSSACCLTLFANELFTVIWRALLVCKGSVILLPGNTLMFASDVVAPPQQTEDGHYVPIMTHSPAASVWCWNVPDFGNGETVWVTYVGINVDTKQRCARIAVVNTVMNLWLKYKRGIWLSWWESQDGLAARS